MIIDLKRLLLLAWERRGLLLPIHAAVVAIAVVVVLLLPRWYASSVTLVPVVIDGLPLNPEVHSTGLAIGPGGVTSPQDQLRLVVRSRAVADSIIDRFGLMSLWRLTHRDEARERLAEHVSVATPLEGQVIVTVEARSAVVARDMAAAYAAHSAREAVRLKTMRVAQGRVYLENRIEVLDRDLALASARVQAFEEQHGAIALEEQTQETLEAARVLQAQQAFLQAELAVARRYFAEGSVAVVVLRDQIEALGRQLERLASAGGDRLLKGDELPLLRQQHLELISQQASLTEVDTLLRKVYEQARLEESDPVPTFSVLDDAQVPERRSRPKRGLTVSLALALSMVFSLGYLQWQEVRRQRSAADTDPALATAGAAS